MPSPPIQIFLTTIASQASLRQRQEYVLRILQVRKIVFTSYDLASDEIAKKLWRRKAPLGKQELPGILVGGRFPGTFSEFEEAVEYDELSTFLRLNEAWDEEIDGDRPAPPVQPVGVPGASSPSQMTNHKPSFAASPSPLRSKNKGNSVQEFDVGTELVGFGLQGVKVTDDELLELVEELGLNDADAGELVKGLGGGGKGVNDPNTSQLDATSAEAKDKQEIGDKSQKNGEAEPDADVEGGDATPAGTEAESEQEAGKDSKDTNKDKHDEEVVKDATMTV